METGPSRLRNQLIRGAIEFVVIVVGVLTALAADEWRQARADRAAESQHLARLTFDLREDSASLRMAAAGFGRKRSALERLVALEPGGAVGQEVADDIATGTGWAWDLSSARSTTYDELRSSGQFGLIRDRGIRAAIARYYADYDDMLGSIDARRTHFGPLSYGLVRRLDPTDFDGSNPARDTRATTLTSSELGVLGRQLEEIRQAATAELNFAYYSESSTSSLADRTEALLERLRSHAES